MNASTPENIGPTPQDLTPIETGKFAMSPTIMLALPLMNTILEANHSAGSQDTVTLSLIYTVVCCTLPFVAYGAYRTVTGIKRAATISYRNSLIKAFSESDPIARARGVDVEETLEGLLAAGGWDNVYAYLRNFSKNHPVSNEIAKEIYRQASKPDFRRPTTADRSFNAIPNLDPQIMIDFHNSRFDENKKREAESMVGATIYKIQTSSGAEREKHIRHLDIHNKMMKAVTDHMRNR